MKIISRIPVTVQTRVVSDEKRRGLKEKADRLDLMQYGKEDSISDLIESGSDYLDFSFIYLGFKVRFYLFFDLKTGAITIDDHVFERFPIGNGEILRAHLVLVEIMMTLVNSGLPCYVGKEIKHDLDVVSHTYDVNDDGMVINLVPIIYAENKDFMKHVMEPPSTTITLEGRNYGIDGSLPIIIDGESLQSFSEFFPSISIEEFGDLFLAVWKRRSDRGERDFYDLGGDLSEISKVLDDIGR